MQRRLTITPVVFFVFVVCRAAFSPMTLRDSNNFAVQSVKWQDFNYVKSVETTYLNAW